MKLDKIALRNYRNFESYEIKFGASTTVLIGKNGTGKTNLISAIKHSLSFIFAKKKDSNQYDFIASSDRKIASFTSTDARFGETPNGGHDYLYPIDITAIGGDENIYLEWSFYKDKASSGLLTSRYEEANEIFWNKYNNSTDIPVLAYFSDSYPHVLTTLSSNMQKMLESGNPLPQNVAYYKWDEDKNCTEIWKQYFTMQFVNMFLLSDDQNKDQNNYIRVITETMKLFSEPENSYNNDSLAIENIEVLHQGKSQVLRVKFKNGDITPFSQLPQGYKRILSIVFDIAHRGYLLNKNCNPKGIVLIDEVELHLHPSLTQEVLQRLRKTFPRIQFIVSTHSPLIVSNFKQDNDNLLYKLYREDSGIYTNTSMNDLYGVDYNSMLSFMDTPETDSYMHDLVSAYKYWVEKKDSDMINKLKNKLKEILGDDNELYRSLPQ